MIPLRLTLKDFLSYGDGEETLDFERFQLACIIGNNGDGKSALLDAITWALWGQARGVDERGAGADSLIHGEANGDEARVEFDFEIRGERFRILRRRHRKRGGSLDFGRVRDGTFYALTGASKRSTQELIDSLLRMNYRTFINSAFILQGQADKFTRQTPAERKRLLADILDLQRYSDLEARARRKARDAERRTEIIDSVIIRLDRELASMPGLPEQVTALRGQLADASKQKADLDARVTQLRAELAALREKAAALEEIRRRQIQIAREKKDAVSQADGFLQQRADLDEVLKRREEIEKGFAELQSARAEEAALSRKQTEFAALTKAQGEARLAIERERSRLEATLAGQRKEARKLSQDLSAQPTVEAELAAARKLVADLREKEAEQHLLRQQLQEWKTQHALLRQQAQEWKEQQEARSHRCEQLAGAEATCPLCEKALKEEERGQLLVRLRTEVEDLETKRQETLKQAEAIAKQGRETENRVTELTKAVAQLGAEERGLGGLERQLQQLKQAMQQQQELTTQIEDLATLLAEDKFGEEARTHLKITEQQLAALGYEAAAQVRLRERLTELGRFEALQARLQQAEGQRALAAEALAKLDDTIKRLSDEEQGLKEKTTELEAAAARTPAREASLRAIEVKAEAAAEDVTRLSSRLAVAEEKLREFEARQVELGRRRQDRQKLAERVALWRELVTAFGKDGIQALVIEASLPELEKEANEILQRIAEGRLQVHFETQRQRKSAAGGDAVETLEIQIRDELGSRRYEMYSGGELFRLDFAIRIALSKLLARRAGAPLQTLVIDEGFGSQDREGRERLVEALAAIRSDFERILVITHIDELKEAFPYRILVTKDESGSHIHQSG